LDGGPHADVPSPRVICGTCGCDNPDKLVFCQECGQRLGPRIAPPTPPIGLGSGLPDRPEAAAFPLPTPPFASPGPQPAARPVPAAGPVGPRCPRCGAPNDAGVRF